MVWSQGEHVAIVGMSGSGKTTLARTLLNKRGHAVMLVTKPDDLHWSGWRRTKAADTIDPRKASKWRLEPSYEQQPGQFARAMDMAWNEGSWCVYVDETYHVEAVGLKSRLVKLLTQGRSKGVSVVCGVQRPAWVRREVFSEASHVFAFKTGDRRDLKALADGISDAFAEAVRDLPKFRYAYVNKWDGRIQTGTVRDLDRVLAQ